MAWRRINVDSSVADGGDDSKLHFGVYSVATTAVANTPATPTHPLGLQLFASSSPEFELITGVDGQQWVKNNSNKTFSMQGTVTYQMDQGAGGAANMFIWSERSNDDGATFTENTFSLRTSRVNNNSDDSQTKSSAVDSWAPGESIRWSMYRTGGAVNLTAPSSTVNGANIVGGLSFYWQLNEV